MTTPKLLKKVSRVNTYYLADKRGWGLHYICGNLYWHPPTTCENLINFTSFNSRVDAAEFARDHCIVAAVAKLTLSTEVYLKKD